MNRTLALLAASVIATGCKQTIKPCSTAPVVTGPQLSYVRVDFLAQRAIGGEAPAEISDTPAYRKSAAGWKTVALRVPNTCLTDTAARVTGTASSSRLILTTQCGIWLKELESALSNAGYRVISWDALHRAESAGDMSTYSAAAKLGADVVFLINSLESNPTTLKEGMNAKMAFSQSNAMGDKLGVAAVDPARQKWLKDYVGDRTGHTRRTATGVKAFAATLDLTAVAASGGESVWFYRRALTRLIEDVIRSAERMSFLFAFYQGKPQWWPVLPQSLQQIPSIQPIPTAPTMSSEVSFGGSEAGGGPEDESRAHELELVRIIVKDFVTNFKNQAAAPAPPAS